MITDREQIHDLAKLTGCQIVKNVCGNPMFTMTTYELQQYTEMVVRKCTNIVLHYTDVDEGVAVAKKHFGVEE
jgi:hypothetical protein